jgi:hypothetical protein
MGFALPTLSFLRLASGMCLPAARRQASNADQIAAPQEEGMAPYAVLTLHQARSRRRSRYVRSPAPAAGSAMAAVPSGRLRIVQHAPGERPECLFISGRMADVCAALERMEASQGQRRS